MRRGRVLLVRHAGTTATRSARFPADEALTPSGEVAAEAGAAGVRRWLAGQDVRGWSSPALRAEQTATALGLVTRPEPALRPWDLGGWTGRALAEVAGEEPSALGAWRSDPDAAAHGGESLTQLIARCRRLLEDWAASLAVEPVAVVAVTHGAVLRALVATALGLPPLGLWQLDAAPGAAAALAARPGGAWTLSALNLPLAALAEDAP